MPGMSACAHSEFMSKAVIERLETQLRSARGSAGTGAAATLCVQPCDELAAAQAVQDEMARNALALQAKLLEVSTAVTAVGGDRCWPLSTT
jgi:hypothetical protein